MKLLPKIVNALKLLTIFAKKVHLTCLTGFWKGLWYYMRMVRIRSFSGLYFLAFKLNTEIYLANLRIQSECGKIRSRKTPNKNTFYVVWLPYGGNIDLKSVKDIVIPASSVAMTFVWTIKALFCAITSPFVKDTMTIIALKFRTSCSLCWLCGCRRTCCCWGWNSGCGCREIRATVHFKPSTWSPMILINYNSHKSCLYGIL